MMQLPRYAVETNNDVLFVDKCRLNAIYRLHENFRKIYRRSLADAARIKFVIFQKG